MFRGDKDLAQRAIDHFILAPYSYGWDEEYGGLYYFLDSEGHSPTQLEWPMKLWWVHCEAMVALLMAFRSRRDASIWSQFTHLCDLTFSKVRWHMQQWGGGGSVSLCLPVLLQFIDAGQGEWYGYLTREWKVNQRFKGGPYKGHSLVNMQHSLIVLLPLSLQVASMSQEVCSCACSC